MSVHIHPHALERMAERGASEDEVRQAVETGSVAPAKFGRSAFTKHFPFNNMWNGVAYGTKEIEVIAALREAEWIVITVIVRYS